MLPQNNPDRIRILFDDHRLVANAGLLLSATVARHLGLRELVDHHLDLGGAPGRANTGDKMLTLVASALAGGDCIDDADALRAGGTVGVLGMYSLYPWRRPSSLLPGVTMTASTPRLPSPPCAVSIPSLLPPARPTGIGSTEAATARPTRHSIALLSSDFVMMSGPRHTCVVAPPRE